MELMKQNFALGLLLGLLSGASISLAEVQTQAFQPSGASRVTFQAVGRPSLLKIKGEGATLQGRLEIADSKATGRFEVNLDQLKTGIDLRDEHMKDNYLKTKEHPKATLEINSLALPAGWKPGVAFSDAPFKGRLSLKGVTKDIDGKVSSKGENLATNAEFTISLNDFDVGVPKYMGITVADKVTVNVEIPSFERK
jgi:polyisoprenoid-binding protein YceI